jgi:hypothetical protein
MITPNDAAWRRIDRRHTVRYRKWYSTETGKGMRSYMRRKNALRYRLVHHHRLTANSAMRGAIFYTLQKAPRSLLARPSWCSPREQLTKRSFDPRPVVAVGKDASLHHPRHQARQAACATSRSHVLAARVRIRVPVPSLQRRDHCPRPLR